MKCPNCKTEIISVDHEHKLQSQIEQQAAKIELLREALKTCTQDWVSGCYGTATEKSFDTKKVKNALAATEPKSNCTCYPDEKDADKRQCNECPR